MRQGCRVSGKVEHKDPFFFSFCGPAAAPNRARGSPCGAPARQEGHILTGGRSGKGNEKSFFPWRVLLGRVCMNCIGTVMAGLGEMKK